MIKQKIQALLFSAVAFGTAASFFTCFFKKSAGVPPFVLIFPFVCLCLLAVCAVRPKLNREILQTALKFQAAAAVIFTAVFILSFLPQPLVLLHLFSVVVFGAAALCSAFELKKEIPGREKFPVMPAAGAVLGVCAGIFIRPCLAYPVFMILSLMCRPADPARSVQQKWGDIAFPLSVLIFSFAVFLNASHASAFSQLIAEAAVMLMAGGLITAAASSPVRMTLMTAVMALFGSYVFSAQNADSVFNVKRPAEIRIEQPAEQQTVFRN